VTSGSPKAIKGGHFRINIGPYPQALLYYLAKDAYSAIINDFTFETLAEHDNDTFELIPQLAEKWTVSKDKKKFTFSLRKEAKFSDGKPVTAHDVKFTFDTLMDPKNKTVMMRSALSSIKDCKVINDHTVQFTANSIHFKNLEKVATLYILPKHVYSKGNFNKDFNKSLLGSGPYTLSQAKRGIRVVLKRNKNYWGKNLPQNIGRYNFDKITFKSVADDNVAYEMFKKGDLDFHSFSSARTWATETNGPLYKKGRLKKIKAHTELPGTSSGIYWNMRRSLFKDKKVRLALAHLMDRKRWIKELYYNQYTPSTGVINARSPYHSPKVKALTYDPKKAKQYLKEAGWTKIDSEGILIKGKKRFDFSLFFVTGPNEKALTRYQQILKRMGIKLNLRALDWAALLKNINDRKFDSVTIGISRSVEPSDFAVLWGSKQADQKGSFNLAGYKNKELDKLTVQIDQTFDKKKRIPMVRKIDEMIAGDQPMAFFWELPYKRIAYRTTLTFEGKGYFKYTSWPGMIQYWWFSK